MKTKTKQKMILLTILIILTLTMQGCGRRTPITNFYTGSQGLEIELLNNAPPRTVVEGSQFSIMINAWNKGAHTIPKDEAFVSVRYDPVYFKQENADSRDFLTSHPEGNLPELSGRSEVWQQGESILIPLTKLRAHEIIGTRETPITNIEVSTCYSYKTYFSEMVCLDTDVYGVDQDPVCRNRGVFTYSDQGAPIAINRLEVDMLPLGFIQHGLDVPAHMPVINESGELIGIAPTVTTEKLVLIEPVIRIYARNVGRGTVFIAEEEQAPNAKSLCSITREDALGIIREDTEKRIYNRVRLVNATLDGFQMDCGEKTTLSTARRDDFIMCRLHPDQTGYLRQNLQAPLNLELEYYYAKSETHQIRIERLN